MKITLNRRSILQACFVLILGCAHPSQKPTDSSVPPDPKYLSAVVDVFPLENPSLVGITKKGQKISSGGFSALQVDRFDDKKVAITVLTDRGPNSGEIPVDMGANNKVRAFLLPDFAPRLVSFELDLQTRQVRELSQNVLKQTATKKMTGLPRAMPADVPREIGVDTAMKRLPDDPLGIDSEGYCRFPNGTFWISDEYGPDLLEFGPRHVLQTQLSPSKGLPSILGKRAINRGFEGLVCDSGKVYAFLQSPLKLEGAKNQKLMRIIEVDATSKKVTGIYLFLLGSGDRLGDATKLGPFEFLIVEQNGKTGSASIHHLVKLNFKTATNLLDRRDLESLGEPETWTEQELNARIHLVQREVIFNGAGTALDDVEKIEGVAVMDSQRVVLVSDNDFALEGDFDLKEGTHPINESKKSKFFILRFSEKLKE